MAKKVTEKPTKPAPVPYRSDSRSAYETMGRSLNTELLEQQARDRARVEQIRNVIRTERQERRDRRQERQDSVPSDKGDKIPQYTGDYYIWHNGSNRWIKGLAPKGWQPGDTPQPNADFDPPPLVSRPPPVVRVSEPNPRLSSGGYEPQIGNRGVVQPSAAVSPYLPQQPGVPQAVVRQSSVAPVPYTPVNRVMVAAPQVTPKVVSSERMGTLGQRPEMGRDFSARSGSSYSKAPKSSDDDGLFKF